MFRHKDSASLLAIVRYMVLGAVCAVVLSLAPQTAQASTMRIQVDEDYSQAYQVVDLVNQQRKAAGLNTLTIDKDLMNAAMLRAAEITVVFSHTRPSGASCLNISSKTKGENIALGQKDAATVMSAWMASQGHKENILYSEYTIIGVGCVKVGGSYYWVQCFGWDKATTCSKSSNVTDKTVSISFNASVVSTLGASFSVSAVASDGETLMNERSSLQVGASQRYALMVHPWSGSSYYHVKIVDSDVSWNVDKSGIVKLNTSNGTVTGIAPGSYTLTAKAANGAISESVARACGTVAYSVSFSVDGKAYGSTQKVGQGGTASKPTDPTKSGYTFNGWYTDSALTKAYNFSTPVTASFTLYAKFTANSSSSSSTNKNNTSTSTTTSKNNTSTSTNTNTSKNNTSTTTNTSKNNTSTTTNTTTNKNNNSSSSSSNKTNTTTNTLKPTSASAGALTSFYDVPSGAWYYSWVTEAAKRGLMSGPTNSSGKPTGYFQPDNEVTRGQVATILWRIAGQPSTTTTALWDARGHWAEKAIAWCMSQGIITGYTSGDYKGMFRPDAPVTRQELAVMSYRFAKWAGVNVSNPPTAAFKKCVDTASVGSWAKDAMVWCAAASIITGSVEGDGSHLNPGNTASRAQAAKIFVQIQKLACGQTTPYSEEADDDSAADEVAEEVTMDEVVTYATTPVNGTTENGLAYAIVSDTDVDENGDAFVLGNEYAELGGRYEGVGAYILSYAGDSSTLALPSAIEGAQVVSANLAWGQGRTIDMAADLATATDAAAAQVGQMGLDDAGHMRLTALAVDADAALVQLNVSGNLLQGIEIVRADDSSAATLSALRFLDMSLNPVTALDTVSFPALEQLSLAACPLDAQSLTALAAWAGTTGLAADLTGAGYTAPEAAQATDETSADAQATATSDTEAAAQDATFEAVEFEEVATDTQANEDAAEPTETESADQDCEQAETDTEAAQDAGEAETFEQEQVEELDASFEVAAEEPAVEEFDLAA